MVFDCFPVGMMYCTDRFVNGEPPLHPRDESHLVMMDNPFNDCWILLARILLRILASIFIREIGL